MKRQLLLLFCCCLAVLAYGQQIQANNSYRNFDQNSGFYFRLQPLYLFTHNTFMAEAEYFLDKRNSLSLEYFYSTEVTEGDFICFACAMTSYAQKRTLIDIQYKFYVSFIYVSPYVRLRNWQGNLDEYVKEPVPTNENSLITSVGFAIGGTIGVRFVNKGRFDCVYYMGWGGYIHESYQVESPYTINDYLKLDTRFGLNLGVRLFK